jgi:hypothetical protein
MSRKRFDEYRMPSEYPPHEVADHEILLSFRNDEDAAFFHEWWEDGGNYLFREWLDNRPKAEQ